MRDELILGAGPAGLQLGYFFERSGHHYQILEAGDGPGTFFKTFPRHRQLISINKVHTGYSDREINLRWDWNSLLGDADGPFFPDYSSEFFPPADHMVHYLRDYAEHHGLRIRNRCRIERLEFQDGHFQAHDTDGEVHRAARVIVATGLRRPYLPPIPGIELSENYVDMPLDREGFNGQRVLVIGKGNSGFETADHLIPNAAVIHVASPNPLRFAWQTHYVGHLRAVNNNFLDTYQLKSQNAILDGTIERIVKEHDDAGRPVYRVSVSYTHAGEESEDLVYDRVLCCTGFRFDDSIFAPSCRPETAINGRFPALTSAWESVNVPSLYFAGTLMQQRDFKKYTSAFIHGFRYNVRALHHIIEQRDHDRPWPARSVPIDPRSFTQTVIARINRTSGLWQQFSVLCDVLVVDGAATSSDGQGRYLEEVPVDFLHQGGLGELEEFFTLTLEFGASQADPFAVERRPDPAHAHESFFLHPVVRHYRGGELLDEHHVLEDLYGEWKKEEVHVAPLRDFFARRLSAVGAHCEVA